MSQIINQIINILVKKKAKLSIVESCTGGMLSEKITSVSGASKVFSFGLITYSNSSKIKYLNVPNKIIRKYGSVSEQCCYSMLLNLSKISKAKLNVAITGIAGPSGGTSQKPVGLVYVGIKKDNKIKINEYLFKGKKRDYIRKETVKKTLELIRKFV